MDHLLAVVHDAQASVTQYNLTLIGQLLAQWDEVIRNAYDLLRKLTFYHVSQMLANMPANIG